MDNLAVTFSKAAATGSLRIGYFGGSITAGEGASDKESTSWRALTTSWFRGRLPDCSISECNAAIGGTGSDLGTFRCGDDLLRAQPDLVFVEFAVNDAGNDESLVARAMEGIVRQTWRRLPRTSIVFVYTMSRGWLESGMGQAQRSVRTHQKIADYYGLDTIDAGQALADYMAGEGSLLERCLPDGTHPSDAGYAVYAEAVRRYLEQAYENFRSGAAFGADCWLERGDRVLPGPLHPEPLEGILLDAWQVSQPGWVKDSRSLKDKYPHMLTAREPGARLSFAFTGTAIGVYWMVAGDSGDVEWSVDGSEPMRVSGWDKYALRFDRAHYVLLCSQLEDGAHTFTLSILQEHHPQSNGTWSRIGAFLIGQRSY